MNERKARGDISRTRVRRFGSIGTSARLPSDGTAASSVQVGESVRALADEGQPPDLRKVREWPYQNILLRYILIEFAFFPRVVESPLVSFTFEISGEAGIWISRTLFAAIPLSTSERHCDKEIRLRTRSWRNGRKRPNPPQVNNLTVIHFGFKVATTSTNWRRTPTSQRTRRHLST